MKREVQVLLSAFSVLLLTSTAATADGLKSEDVYKKTVPSIVTLKVETKDGQGVTGSGFLAVKDGLAITAWHVVHDAKRVVARFSSGEEFDSSGLVNKDEKRDLALIRVKVFGRPLLTLSPTDPDVGSKAYAIGAPKGLDFTITDGLVSQVRVVGETKEYQFSCAVSPGNSGGPLLNEKGEAVGIISWKRTDGDDLSFAIPTSYALGLDSSLPTQPWEAVKSENPLPQQGQISNDQLDKYIAEGMKLNLDGYAFVLYTFEDRIHRKNGYRDGVPPELYSLRAALLSKADGLEALVSSDSSREIVRTKAVEIMRARAHSLDLIARAIKTAQAFGGWTPQANDLVSQAVAATQVFETPELAEWKIVTKSKAYQDSLLPDMRRAVGSEPDPTGFSIGLIPSTIKPLSIIFVPEKSLAYKLGFRSGDYLKSADGHPVESLLDLKQSMKTHIGDRLKIEVIRKGEIKELNPRIPEDLPPLPVRKTD